MYRRQFLQTAVTTTALPLPAALSVFGAAKRVSLLLDNVSAASPRWAADQLHRTLVARGIEVYLRQNISQVPSAEFCIAAANFQSPLARQILDNASLAGSGAKPEALAIATGTVSGRTVLLAAGQDDRGLVYALLELADRASHGADPVTALHQPKPVLEQPANRIRSMSRAFVSDVEDKPWFNDRAMWSEYLTTLATQRFNRFNLCLSLGYDFMRQVTDAYFLFPLSILVRSSRLQSSRHQPARLRARQ